MKISNLYKIYHNKYGDNIALDHISFEIKEKGIHAIVGPSGCGKSTLLGIIAGKDKDYTGIIEIEGVIETIEQEICLYESMSVMDNLALVCEDIELITNYLEQFEMQSFKKTKVKKLSIGQKKRVQIIRSLLIKPNYLLCDEPTAALDFENAKKVMDLLREVSNEISVLVVTHDIALVDNYADSIIKMGKGVISSISYKNQKGCIDSIQQPKISPTYIQYFKLIKNVIFSRKIENALSFLLLFILVICFFITALFGMVDTSVEAKDRWRTQENIIQPVANSENNIYHATGNEKIDKEMKASIDEQKQLFAMYAFGSENTDVLEDMPIYYDLYTKKDIDLLRDNLNEVLGYEISNIYGNLMLGGSFAPLIYSEDSDEYQIDKSNYEGYQDVFVDSMGVPAVDSWATVLHENMDSSLPQSSPNMHFDIYQIFEGRELPLQYGEWFKNDTDIVLSSTAADRLMRSRQLSSVEGLIGMPLEVRLDKYKAYGKYEQEAVHSSKVATTFTITGITYDGRESELDDEYQLFVKDGAWSKVLTEFYELDQDKLVYNHLRLLIQDDVDIPTTIMKVEDLLNSTESHFITMKDLSVVEYREDYQNPLLFYAFFILLSIGLCALYFVQHLISVKRDAKEQFILTHYGYNVWKYIAMKMSMSFILIALILALTLSFIVSIINAFANQLGYAYMVQMNMTTFMICFIASIIYCILCESIFIIIRRRKW